MVKINLRHNIANGKYTLLVASVFYLTSFFFLRKDVDVTAENGSMLWDSLVSVFPSLLTSKWTTLVTHSALVYLILELDAVFALNRIRTTFHISVFLFILSISPFLLNVGPLSLSALLIAVSLFPLFYSYQDRNSSPRLFYSGLFFGLAAMFSLQLLCLFAVYFFSMIAIGSFNARSFFAWLWGFIMPGILFSSCCYCFGCVDFLKQYNEYISGLFHPDYSAFCLLVILNAAAVFFLAISSFSHLFYTSFLDKIKTRILLYIISWFAVLLILSLLLFPSQATGLVSASVPFVSIMAAHMFCLSNTRNGDAFFYIILVMFMALFTFNLYSIYA